MAGANGGFGANTGQLSKAANDIHSCFTDVNSQVSTLTTQLEPLKAQWRGAAATAFQQVWMRWEGDMQKIDAALSELGDHVSQASGQYQQSDVTQQENISNVMKALG
jgi:WXG100 family type VII secretion target